MVQFHTHEIPTATKAEAEAGVRDDIALSPASLFGATLPILVPPSPGVWVFDTPPEDPYDGMLWWESDTSILWTWYVDPDSAQWVQISGGTGSKSSVIIADTAPDDAENGQLWWSSSNGNLYCWYHDGDSEAWVQVNTSGGSQGHVTPFMFGGVGDGVADDTAAINAAINYLTGGGTVDMSGGRWLVDSGNIVVKQGVALVGSWLNVGVVSGGNYLTLNSSIILNPAYTISLIEDFSALKGLVIVRKGMSVPTTTRQALDQVALFSGTAITVGDGTNNKANDTYVGYCLVLGFQYAYRSDFNSRNNIEYLRGDCINGVWMAQSHDMQHLSHCHFWPYTFFGLGLATPMVFAVTGAGNNGSGLVRLTTATHPLITGDIVTVEGVAGTVEANGRWTVTVINATTIDLQGSAFVNAYAASSGEVHASYHVRHGTAYNFANAVDWAQADNCYAYGFDVGFNIENSSAASLLNCGVDHDASSYDLTTIGIRVKGTDASRAQLIGCRTAATGTGVLIDTVDENTMITSHTFWGLRGQGLSVLTGFAILSDSLFFDMPVGILVDPNSNGVHVTGNRVDALVTTPITLTGAALRKSTVMWNSWTDASSVGTRESLTFSQSRHYFSNYITTVDGPIFRYQKARGTAASPLGAASGDYALQETYDLWDGVSAFQTGATYRVEATAATSATSSPAKHVWGTTAVGSITPADRMELTQNRLLPVGDRGLALGSSTVRWENVYAQGMALIDGITAPATITGMAILYVDTADGDLKVKFGDGTIKTIVVDT